MLGRRSFLVVAVLAAWSVEAEHLAAGDIAVNERLIVDCQDGKLDSFSLIEAALIASGASDEPEVAAWLNRYNERSQILSTAVVGSPAERLRTIHDGLHQRLLTGDYRRDGTDLRQTLARGDYNCLSSLVLYFDLCDAAGIDLEIWSLPGHVLVRSTDHPPLVVEPSVPEWTADGSASIRAARQLTPVQLLGKFYYNRGVERLKQKDFAQGLDLLETSLQFDPADAEARHNLAAGLNNWAVEHWQRERYEAAAALIEQGRLIDRSFQPLILNERLLRERLPE